MSWYERSVDTGDAILATVIVRAIGTRGRLLPNGVGFKTRLSLAQRMVDLVIL